MVHNCLDLIFPPEPLPPDIEFLTRNQIMQIADILDRGCQALSLSLSFEARERILLYLSELLKWNDKMNLVASAPGEEIMESHFLDSLTLLPLLPADREAVLLDVGTGAGFPGLVLKAARPSLSLTLAEPRAKRVTFLRHVIRTLQFSGVEIIANRLGPSTETEQATTYSLITSRALADITGFLDLAADYSPPGGSVICMKGRKAEKEIGQWRQNRPDSLFRLQEIVERTLPFSGATRKLVIFRKY